MEDSAASILSHWESFYVIVGSSAAALTGLMFVVIALVHDTEVASRSPGSVAAFGTPNVVHFCAVLLISAVLSAPWEMISHPALVMVIAGLLGVIYSIVVLLRARRQTAYRPELEDWIWHITLPIASYAVLLVAGVGLHLHRLGALFLIAAASLVLLFVGIHNAWDTVTYLTVTVAKQKAED